MLNNSNTNALTRSVLLLADMLIADNRFAEAIDLSNYILSADETQCHARYSCARALAGLGRFPEALTQLTKARDTGAEIADLLEASKAVLLTATAGLNDKSPAAN